VAGGRAPRFSRKVLPLSGMRVTSLLGAYEGRPDKETYGNSASYRSVKRRDSVPVRI